MSIKLIENYNDNLNENFFKTEGLEIANEVCHINSDTNTNCEEVTRNVVAKVRTYGIDCKVVKPFVVCGDDTSNNHYSILYKDMIIDYCLMQFLGDNKTVNYFELYKNNENVYALSLETMKGITSTELENLKVDNLLTLDISKIPDTCLVEILI